MSLAKKLDDAVSHVNPTHELALDKLLQTLPRRESDALQRALSDYDPDHGRYRVSSRVLSQILTDEGHKFGPSVISKYRRIKFPENK